MESVNTSVLNESSQPVNHEVNTVSRKGVLGGHVFCCLSRVGHSIELMMNIHGIKDIAKLAEKSLALISKSFEVTSLSPLIKNLKNTKMFMKMTKTVMSLNDWVSGAVFKKSMLDFISKAAFLVSGSLEALGWLGSIGLVELGSMTPAINKYGGALLLTAVAFGIADLVVHNKIDTQFFIKLTKLCFNSTAVLLLSVSGSYLSIGVAMASAAFGLFALVHKGSNGNFFSDLCWCDPKEQKSLQVQNNLEGQQILVSA